MSHSLLSALRLGYLIALLGTVAACGSNDDSANGPNANRAQFADAQRAQCVQSSPYLDVGKGMDAPSERLSVPHTTAVTTPDGDCAGNRDFRFGSGIHDITGVIANTSGMGWEDPTQVFTGLHLRQYARAFTLLSPCNDKRVVFVSADLGIMSGAVRLGVLQAINNDADLASHYGPQNVMLSATHTHNGPAGYSHYEAFNLFHFGLDQLVLDTIISGIVEAIRQAHSNLEAHPQTARIQLAVGELLNTNINRSLPAFEMNSETERLEFLNSRGEVVDTDKRMVQLNLVRNDGSAVGVINWFGVHPTVVGQEIPLVSSDNKGYASLGFERIMRTDYNAAPGSDNFVAAFAQKDEGDASPNIFIVERPHPDPTRGGGADPLESAAISGTKQLAKALELFQQGQALQGPVDSRLFHVQMDAVEVTDPVVLASLQHPDSMDANEKRTCLAALGPSFGAGAEDGPGPSVEGVDCSDDPDFIQSATDDFMALAAGKIPPALASTAVLCNVDQLPALDLSCHAEKPVLFAVGPPLSAEPNILPFQLMRVGNLAILGIPWEVTTISARRIQKLLFPILAPVGIDTIVVAGLVNDFVHYLTTREEYAAQQYEGASNIFGPWTLAAVQQESRRLAQTLAEGSAAPAGPDYVDGTALLIRTPYIPSDLPGLGTRFGDVLSDAPANAAAGETITVSFQAGHPRNNLKLQSSYVFVERQLGPDEWEVVATDRDPEVIFRWNPLIPSPLPIELPEVGPSTAEAIWHIPANIAAGTYRIRHEGAAQTLILPLENYAGSSSPFTITATTARCP